MAIFSAAFDFILPNEGGYVNNPEDRGGPTNLGITERVARENGYSGRMEDLSIDFAAYIYETKYWPGLENIENQAVASKILDLRANFGVSGGDKIAQMATNNLIDPEISVDGKIGPYSIEAINSVDPSELLAEIAAMAAAHYRAIVLEFPKKTVFLNGWLKRAAKFPPLVAVETALGLPDDSIVGTESGAVAIGSIGLIVLLFIGAGIWIFNRGGR